MVTLGIDPGSAVTGYGVVAMRGSRLIHVASGAVRPPRGLPLAERLARIHAELARVIADHAPAAVAVEDLFVARHARAAVVLGQVRGVCLLAAAQAGLPVATYTARAVKQAVVGYGQAEKGQVAEMVRRLLGLAAAPRPADVTDALALALCHLQQSRFHRRLAEGVVQ
ncbi:MAG: crossover junction endodeoxyribonuclease RuvC [Nitrospirae bacterium]|nr:MAG: crossover junction endodeoxyribonuclease RuvC [Nitrospirota bacterium]